MNCTLTSAPTNVQSLPASLQPAEHETEEYADEEVRPYPPGQAQFLLRRDPRGFRGQVRHPLTISAPTSRLKPPGRTSPCSRSSCPASPAYCGARQVHSGGQCGSNRLPTHDSTCGCFSGCACHHIPARKQRTHRRITARTRRITVLPLPVSPSTGRKRPPPGRKLIWRIRSGRRIPSRTRRV